MATHDEMRKRVAQATRFAQARRLGDGDGDWAACYADDVSQLLRELAIWQSHCTTPSGWCAIHGDACALREVLSPPATPAGNALGPGKGGQ